MRPVTRAKVLGLVTLLVLGAMGFEARASESLLVYYPTTLPVKSRQDVLKTESGGADVTVFAKFRDFADQVKAVSPAMVIAPSNFGTSNPDYKPVLRFFESNSGKFKYLVLALSQALKDVKMARLGLVEETEREILRDFIDGVIGSNVKAFKTVSKPEDLFPLLVFKSVDMILVSPSNYERLQKQFSSKVFKILESKPVDGITVFSRTGKDAASIAGGLEKLSAAALKDLGFSKIEKLGGGQ